jgi:hypothetical protein
MGTWLSEDSAKALSDAYKNADIHAGNEPVATGCDGKQHGTPHGIVKLVKNDGPYVCPICQKGPFVHLQSAPEEAAETIDWEAHRRFMRGM